MADNMDAVSDTSIGSKKRIPHMEEEKEEEEEALLQLQTQPQQEERPPFSNSFSSVPIQDGPKAPTLLVSSPKEDQEAVPDNNSFEEPMCSHSGSHERVFLCDLVSGSSDFGENVETLYLRAQENWNSDAGFVSNDEGNQELQLLEVKKRQLLAELEGGPLLKNKNCTEISILGSLKGIGESVRGSLKVEVIDDTALVVPVTKSANGGAKIAGKAGKKNEKREGDGKKAKAPRRRMKDEKKGVGTHDWQKKSAQIGETRKELVQVSDAGNGGLMKGDTVKIKYSGAEMECLRFVDVMKQRKLWRDVYTGLEGSVVKGYDDMASSKHQKKSVQCSFDGRQRFGRTADAPGILGEVSSENVDCELSVEENDVVNVNELDPGCSLCIGGKDAYMGSEGEYSDEEDSDDDYASIQRPAFLVEGEPDFDSGPPQDGLEYLRRVRWEAAHIPKVTVAKLDRSKFNKEQSVYMPQIPEISKCPEHLLPSKQWEDAFLNNFSKLRTNLSHDDGTGNQVSRKLKPMAVVHEKSISTSCFVETITLEKLNNLRTDEVHSSNALTDSSLATTSDLQFMVNAEGNNGLASSVNPTPKGSAGCNTSSLPTFSAIMTMDSVARVSMLLKRIGLAASMSTLSRDDCVWLFALCAAVDTPLDADTCAALRSLLRKCASLRAEKSEPDDEVVMLNILATIAGRYFGQSDS